MEITATSISENEKAGSFLDLCEEALEKAIEAGDISAITFALMTRGRERGFGLDNALLMKFDEQHRRIEEYALKILNTHSVLLGQARDRILTLEKRLEKLEEKS